MSLPFAQTTPVTEAIESWVDRVTASLDELGPLAEQAISDATRVLDPDTTPATTFYNAGMFWTALPRQTALTGQRIASNLVLLATDDAPTILNSTGTVEMPVPASSGDYWGRVTELVWSNGDVLPQFPEPRLLRDDGTAVTAALPLHFDGQNWASDVTVQLVGGWVSNPIPTGPLFGKIELMSAETATGHTLGVQFLVS